MWLSFLHLVSKYQGPEGKRDFVPSVIPHEIQSMSVEGVEFLDDALRMEDLVPRTDESVAGGGYIANLYPIP